ncbi:nitrilase-related carbon-nitrogen hydrolase [Chloroflexota bacterium]
MVLQYMAVGIQNDMWWCHKRADYKRQLKHVADSIRKAVWVARIDLPVRLVALCEGALGGFAYGAGGEGHFKAYRELVPEIPGEETEFLGQLCKEMDFYLVAQMQAKDVELMEDRIFNIAFIIDPEGKVIHKHHKTAFWPMEYSTAPSDIWDRYIEKYGNDPVKLFEAIYPVARTDIGNIGTIICAEGSFPEAARGLALNGAEIIWRTQYPEPWMGNGMFEVQNKSHAIFNTCYVVAPNLGDVYGTVPGAPEHRSSYGKSQIIDYRGNVTSEYLGSGESFVSAIINVDGLRDFRVRSLWQNLVKDLRIEEYKIIYDAMMAKGGIYPRNLCMGAPPMTEPEQIELRKHQVNRMVELGIYTPPPDWRPFTISREMQEKTEELRGEIDH